MEEASIAFILHEVVGALEYLHSELRMHRDLKAANILLSAAGDVKMSGALALRSSLKAGIAEVWHSQLCMHRDLGAVNILLSTAGDAKMSGASAVLPLHACSHLIVYAQQAAHAPRSQGCQHPAFRGW